MTEKRRCQHCGQEFEPRGTLQTFCKPSCKAKAVEKARGKQNEENEPSWEVLKANLNANRTSGRKLFPEAENEDRR